MSRPSAKTGAPTTRHPQDELGQKVAEVLSDFGVAVSERTDDLYELGIDSIKLIQLRFAINAAFGTSLEIRDVFGTTTFGELVDLVQSSQAATGSNVTEQSRSVEPGRDDAAGSEEIAPGR